MSAAVASPQPPRTVTIAAPEPRPQIRTKKTRVVRRRGRGNHNNESDEEIEREVGTDSDTEDELSSLDSASDSDTEPASEDVIPNGHPRVITPNTSQSPADGPSLNKASVAHLNSDITPFFAANTNWSEMVTDENDNGPADLPVIDFAEFDTQSFPSTGPRPRKSKKSAKKVRPVSESITSLPSPVLSAREENDNGPDESANAIPTSQYSPNQPVRRLPGQTARQAYQQRLETDPSYVPTVGGFWGHDDRLLDKDLRSLSGWWRGRWQGNGRGRGLIMRGRGRGGYFGPQVNASNVEGQVTDAQVEGEPGNHPDVPPIERAWTHDGFEEMKRKEEQRRGDAQQTRPTGALRGGRGGFVPARGGRGGFSRGGFTASSSRSRVGSPFLPPGRVWFAMKPELMWTKQHDGFLHFDAALKPRQGQGPGYRVRFPGKQPEVIRALPRSYPSAKPPTVKSAAAATASVFGSDDGDKTFVVCLPVQSGKEKVIEPVTTIEEPPIDDIFTVRPRLVARNPIPLFQPVITSDTAPLQSSFVAPPSHVDAFVPTPNSQPEASIRSQLEQLSLEPQVSDPARWAQTEEAVLRRPPPATEEHPQDQEQDESEAEQRPPLPPLQTVFTPPAPQPSPGYGSPYAYAPPMPPGIAMNQHGMPYELVTGRPVYLQAPPPMYNPRPLMHSHMVPPGLPFVPGHIHHHSTVSPDFLAQPPSHTPPLSSFIDPSTGAPIFSFPRQNSRIEIRAPTDDGAGKSPGKPSTRRPSGLRTTAVTFEPTQPSENDDTDYFPSLAGPDTTSYSLYPPMGSADGSNSGDDTQGASQHMMDQSMMYPPYQQQQQYYYPDAYGYPQYMDMSQAGQYEMYPPDPRAPQGTVYY